MLFYPESKIILFPERYLILLLLPWQLWILGILLYPFIPTAIRVSTQHNQIYYICPYGEIKRLGLIIKEITYSRFKLVLFKNNNQTCSVLMVTKPLNYKKRLFTIINAVPYPKLKIIKQLLM